MTSTRPIVDASPLGGEAIDVAARIAWAMRMARLTSPAPSGTDRRLRTVATLLGTSAARLSRAETGRLRDGRLLDGYETVFGLEPGSLRAPIDVMCRTFPHLSPVDTDPRGPALDVPAMSSLTEALLGPDPVAGATWLRWARALSVPGNIALRESDCRTLLTRLVRELAGAVSHGYPTRYESLALLRCSAYGHLVLEVAREEVARPGAPGLADLLSAVGEAVTPDAVDWCLELLTGPDDHLAACGALAIENMGEITGAAFWTDLAPRLVAAFEATAAGSRQEEWAAHLIRLAPPAVFRACGLVPARSLPAAPEVETVTDAEANRMWRDCLEGADEIAGAAGLGEQPMLARLLFDIAYGPWESRAVTSYMLLGALPALAPAIGAQIARLARAATDPRVRERATRRQAGLRAPTPVESCP